MAIFLASFALCFARRSFREDLLNWLTMEDPFGREFWKRQYPMVLGVTVVLLVIGSQAEACDAT